MFQRAMKPILAIGMSVLLATAIVGCSSSNTSSGAGGTPGGMMNRGGGTNTTPGGGTGGTGTGTNGY